MAQRFLARGANVIATTRDPSRLIDLGATVINLNDVPKHVTKGSLVLHSIPPEAAVDPVELLGDRPARVVYLSSTAVYGALLDVDENSPVDSDNERARPRLIDEKRVAAGPWSTLILRPAGIYGPGRSALDSVRKGTYVAGDNFVSRIHVDDLAAHVEAGLLSDLEGAYPVADEQPATTREVAEFCADLLGISREQIPSGAVARRMTGNRKVDGSAIRQKLEITLRYPSFREGMRACIGSLDQ